MILHPMCEDAKEAIGSMGDDAPLAVLSDTYRGMHHYFRQNFSQVTNPPIDSLRERNVMTIRTRLGNLGNILDELPEQSEMLSLQSPIVLNAEFEAMRKYMGDTAARIDCAFDPERRARRHAPGLRPHLQGSRGCRALGLPAYRPDRRQHRRRAARRCR